MTYQLPSISEVAIRPVLERHARRWPDEVFISFADGTSWTRRQGLEQAYAAANELRRAGVGQGDRVGVLLGNGPAFFRAWWGTAVLGATLVPINTAYRGTLLAHLLRLSAPTVLVADAAGHARVDELDDASVRPVVRLGPEELCSANTEAPALSRPLAPRDTAILVMTSGTTGPSKLAPNTAAHLYLGGSWFSAERGRGREDLFLVDLPLFHAAALWLGTAALVAGTRLTVRPAPAMSSYWETARDTGATMGILLSTMVPFLLGRPVTAAENEHRMRTMIANPPPPDIAAFQRRFHLPEVWTAYGMTEVPAPLTRVEQDVMEPGYCGRPREGFECRLVDDDDLEVPPGTPGQLIVRTAQPWMISSEYLDNPEATAVAWRNGWFHTGDLMRREGERYFFVDRIKEAMRRRGENISSAELEAEIRTHPAVVEVACVPYRPPGGVEDEVKAWIVAEPDVEIDFAELLRYCVDRMAHFMVPRYFELIGEFPKTPSQRIKKFALRELGNGPGTWDREQYGLRVTRAGLQQVEPA